MKLDIYLVVLCLDIFYVLQVAAELCPKALPIDATFELHDKCYYVGTDDQNGVSWGTAQSICTSNHGNLALITTAEANEELLRTINDRSASDSSVLWIGLKKDGGVWKWLNGKNAYYTNWNDTKDSGDCTQMSLMDGKWLRSDCGNHKWDISFLCEYGKPSSGSGSLLINLYTLLLGTGLLLVIS